MIDIKTVTTTETASSEESTPLLCVMGVHRWSKWVDLNQGRLLNDGVVVGRFMEQQRRCLLCNKAQCRRVEW